MSPNFSTTPQPHEEAIAFIRGKRPVAGKVFYGLLPELRARAFTVSGIEGASTLQRIRDHVAGLPAGTPWDDVKEQLVGELDPFLGEGSERRAEMILRTSGFQSFTAATYRTAQEDDDTTHLQYVHGDQAEVPTPSHEALDGIVLPKNDPFWQTHTGPWGHIGCVCYVRPMNEDLVAEERERDQAKKAEDRNVFDAKRAEDLGNGRLLRNGRSHDVLPPQGPGAFQWHPDDLRLPLGEVLQRYDEKTQGEFTEWARNHFVGPETTVWNWLNSSPAPARSRAEAQRTLGETVRKSLEKRQPASESETEYASADQLRNDSERFFRGGQTAFGQHERVWGASLAGDVVRALEEEWSAQIAAVATGRKPLFHEAIGESAPAVAAELRKRLPDRVEVRATGDAIFIYRPDVIARQFAPGEKRLWEEVQAHAEDGLWLGYGLRSPIAPGVRVAILNPEGKEVSGFRAPLLNPESWGQQRADDFTLALGRPHRAVVIRSEAKE